MDALKERDFWREDALARLEMAIWTHRACRNKGDEDRASRIRVGTIYPTLAALNEAKATEWATAEERGIIAEATALRADPDDYTPNKAGETPTDTASDKPEDAERGLRRDG